jgi:hypothetical protein
VQAAGQDFLAGAGFAVDEHRDVAIEGPPGDVQGAAGGAVGLGLGGIGVADGLVGRSVPRRPDCVADLRQQRVAAAGLEAGFEAEPAVAPQGAVGQPSGQGALEGFGRAVEEPRNPRRHPGRRQLQQLAGGLVGAQQRPSASKAIMPASGVATARCGCESSATGRRRGLRACAFRRRGRRSPGLQHRDRAAVAVTGGVEDAGQLAGRVEQRHRRAGEGADSSRKCSAARITMGWRSISAQPRPLVPMSASRIERPIWKICPMLPKALPVPHRACTTRPSGSVHTMPQLPRVMAARALHLGQGAGDEGAGCAR